MTKETDLKEEVVEKKPKRKTATNRKAPATKKRKINAQNLQKVDDKKTHKTSNTTKTKKSSEVVDKKGGEEKVEPKDVLPKDYFPKYNKYGLNEGYLSLPYRVFKFIEDNKTDWYYKIDDYPFFGEVDFFYSVLYYILQDGFVNVQDLRSNKFYKLTIL